jgi:RNA polymerase sigma-70 factor (ECF subfamily)
MQPHKLWVGTVPEFSDENALDAAIQGDPDAFGWLYERYVNQIYTYVFYRTGNSHDAEDITERVFLRAMRHIVNYRNRGLPFSSWLYRIAHNLVANWHRDNSRRQEIPIDDITLPPSRSDHPELNLEKAEELDYLLNMIRKLPPERQQLLILKFVERMSNAEIGLIMGRTEGAVKSLYHRTLLSLREEVDDDGVLANIIEPGAG